jgi:hypothetical protein
MNHRFRFRTRLFAFFLAAQFLNVQIQSAYGTEAVMAYSPEQQQMLEQIENQVLHQLEDRSEKQLNRVAYRLYKLNVKLRNQLAKTSDEAIQLDADDQATIETFSMKSERSQTETPTQALKEARNQANRDAILAQQDDLLMALGSKAMEDGKLSKVSFQEFKENVSQLKTKSMRAPASAGRIIIKVILSLLVLAGAGAVLLGLWLLAIVFIFAGGFIITVGTVVLMLTIAAIITGMVFAIKAIFSIKLPRSKDPGVVAPHWPSIAA